MNDTVTEFLLSAFPSANDFLPSVRMDGWMELETHEGVNDTTNYCQVFVTDDKRLHATYVRQKEGKRKTSDIKSSVTLHSCMH